MNGEHFCLVGHGTLATSGLNTEEKGNSTGLNTEEKGDSTGLTTAEKIPIALSVVFGVFGVLGTAAAVLQLVHAKREAKRRGDPDNFGALIRRQSLLLFPGRKRHGRSGQGAGERVPGMSSGEQVELAPLAAPEGYHEIGSGREAA